MAQPLAEDNLWLFGVVLAVFGTLVGTIGKQMIRRSEMYKQDTRERERAPLERAVRTGKSAKATYSSS